jgi:uncharacterized protein
LAGTGITGSDLLLIQTELIAKASGSSDVDVQKMRILNNGAYDLVTKSKDTEGLKKDLTNYMKEALKDSPNAKDDSFMHAIEKEVNRLASPWMQFFLTYNPAIVLKDVHCPVLALNGDKDLQVPSKINLEAIKKGLAEGKNKSVTIKEFKNLNHLFQECTTGSPDEYAKIEQTFSPLVLSEISNWISGMLR